MSEQLSRCQNCGRFWPASEEPLTCQAIICPKVKCQATVIQIETTPAIPAEKRTSIPDGYLPPVMEPSIQTNAGRLDGRVYAVWISDPRTSRSWGFYEAAGLVARLDQHMRRAKARTVSHD